MKNKIMTVLVVLFSCILVFVGCKGNTSDTDVGEKTFYEKIATAKFGLMTGSKAIAVLEDHYPDAEVLEFDNLSSAVEALKANKIDYVITSRAIAVNFKKNNKDTLCVIDENILDKGDTSTAAAVRKGDERLDEINEIITRFLNDGTMDKIIANWVSETAANDTSIIPRNADTPVWKVGVAANREPMCFIRGENEICGLDAELTERIAYEMGMHVEFVNMNFPALIPALESGRVDFIISNMGATEERRQIVDFTVPYFENPYVVLAGKTEENLAFAAEYSSEKTSSEIDDEKLSNAKFGVMQGSVAIGHIEGKYPNASIMEFDAIGDAVEALKANKVDYVMTAYSTAKNFERYNKELAIYDGISFDEKTSMAVRKGNTELKNNINVILDGYKKDGTLDRVIANWLSDDAPYDISGFPANKEGDVLNVGISANREPMCFIMDGKYCGVDCELIEHIAYDMGMRVVYQDMKFSALIPALDSGKVDVIISNITQTEERAQVVDFTDSYYGNPQVLLMRKADISSVDESESENFIDKIKASFTRTFIVENRWKLVLNGLGVTILISLCSFIIGSLWGGVICAGLRSSKKIANIPAKVYVRLLQGTPIVVLLMILYYIIFKSFDISAIIVAVIGFALNLGAYTSEIFRTAIDSVDKGQIEAASAIGFSKFKVFSKIIFPQAARNALPVYKGEFISLVKSTSIVGYIAIQDLTKASDIIRSRTYEAFFPLIATAIIYFVVTYIFIVLLNMLEKKIDPKRRKRTLKGVVLK